jgi:hypothetical protein
MMVGQGGIEQSPRRLQGGPLQPLDAPYRRDQER